jgi:catechol 2,3-dioxygenase-like lactoylglutathione lyase family enzyme
LPTGTCRGAGLIYVIMQLNHIGLNISGESEVRNFYEAILGFEPVRDIPIPRTIAENFFHEQTETRAFLVKNGNLALELFLYGNANSTGFAHLCIETDDREKIARLCKKNGYPVMRMQRENKPDLLFIKDRQGNIFELKNKAL